MHTMVVQTKKAVHGEQRKQTVTDRIPQIVPFVNTASLIKLAGYSYLNKAEDQYKRAKEACVKDYTDSNFKGLSEAKARSWTAQSGWIGLLIPQGFILVDIDDKEEFEWVRGILQNRDVKHHAIQTPNGGQLFFKDPGTEKSQRVKMISWAGFIVDYRLAGKGYIVLPGENTPDREWLTVCDEALDTMPVWFNSLAQMKDERPFPFPIPYGAHDDTLHRHACRLQEFGISDDDIIDIVMFMGDHVCDSPYNDDVSLKKTIQSALKHKKGSSSSAQQSDKTQSKLLVELTQEMVFFHTPEDEAYVRLPIKGHFENWKVRSTGFKTLLSKSFYDRYKKVCGGQALADALGVLEGRALHDGEERRVYIRTADAGGALYLNLCNEHWQAVEITPAGWRIVDNPPVMFKRTKTMGALPVPIRSGSIEDLKPFLNCRGDEDFMLIVAWLLSAFRSDQPFPILTVQGEQGSAKSTATKIARSLIDPSIQPLTNMPDDERDLAIKANGTWVLAVDNLSGISGKVSDALCKLSTGGGSSTRKLHTDDEEMIFNAMRPVILNGIDDIAKRPDLLDRAIIINLPAISPDKRKPEQEIWQEFEEVKPGILGALLDAVCGALNDVSSTKIEGELPRMLDFALWSQAAWGRMGWDWLYDDFMKMYRDNRYTAINQGVESDPFASALLELIDEQGKIEGTISSILSTLQSRVSYHIVHSNAWPKPNKFSARIRRIAPALRAHGVEYDELQKTNKGKMVSFERKNA